MATEFQTTYADPKVSLPSGDITHVLGTMGYLELGVDGYFVIGGANLVLRGIKRSTVDVDMLVSDDVFGWLSELDGAEIHDPPKSAQRQGADNTTVWVRNNNTPLPVSATIYLGDGYYPMSYASHHPRTEIVQGVVCLQLNDVRASKEALQRPKDLKDLELIGQFLGEVIDLPPPSVSRPLWAS